MPILSRGRKPSIEETLILVDVRGRVKEVADGSQPFTTLDSYTPPYSPAVAYTIVLETHEGPVLRRAHVRVLAQPYLSLQPTTEDRRNRLLVMANSSIGVDWFFTMVAAGKTPNTMGLSFRAVHSLWTEPDVYYVGDNTRVSLGTWPEPFDLNVDYDTGFFPGNGSEGSQNAYVWGRVVAVSEYFDVSQTWVVVEDSYAIPSLNRPYTSILLLQQDWKKKGRFNPVLSHLPNEQLARVHMIACADAEGRYRVGPLVRGEIYFDQLAHLKYAYVGHSGSRYHYIPRDDPSD